MAAFLLVASLLAVLSPSQAIDVIWYISPGGSPDIATCGRSEDSPCDNLQTVLSLLQTNLRNETTTCYLPSDATPRDSTTLYFMGAGNTVPPVCLEGWLNLRVVGLGSDAGVIRGESDRSASGGGRGIFEFANCTNITIDHLGFSTTAIGRAVLYFEASRDIRVESCTFPVTARSSQGVKMLQCAGNISLYNDTFYGDPTQDSTNLHPLGLDMTHGCTECTSTSIKEPQFDYSSLSFSLSITSCVFQDLANEGPPEDSYKSARTSAVGLRLQLAEMSTNNHIIVTDSTFQRITNTESNGVLVSFNGRAENNQVLFDGCQFRHNRVRYGGGMSSYFYQGPAGNSFRIQNCEFFNNTADFEGGGVFGAFLSSGSNTVSVSNSTFVGNSAQAGCGVFLLNNPEWLWQRGAFDTGLFRNPVEVELKDCNFERNVASFRGGLLNGVVTVLRIQINIRGVSNFTGNNGSAVILRLSILVMEGEATFRENRAVAGGALSILEASKVDLTNVSSAYFLENTAFQGGAIYADLSSTSHLATEYNHSIAQGIFGGCFILFGNEIRPITEKNPRRFTFSGNTASADGQQISSFSLRGCLASNFIPMEISNQFLNFPSDGTVFQATAPNMDPLQGTSTGPSFLFFFGASTRCYKEVNGITYLLPNCSHALLNSTFYLHPDMRCGLLSLTDELRDIYDHPGTGLRPTVDKLILPWAAIDTSWSNPPQMDRSSCPEPDPGNLVLSPAPGEEFDLTIELADQLLNYAYDTIYFMVETSETFDGASVLIQFNGLQYGVAERIFFTPNRPLSQMALVGTPGSVGRLRVVAESQIVGQNVELLIPFQLANCPMGYYPSPVLTNQTQVDELISGPYQFTQRIPIDPYQPLACHCFSERDSPVQFSSRVGTLTNRTNECIGGYTVQLSGSLWAGLIPGDDQDQSMSEFPPTVPCPYPSPTSVDTPIQDNLTNAVNAYRKLDSNSSRNLEPTDVVSYFGLVDPGGGATVKCFERNISDVITYTSPAVFTIELCSQGYCQGTFASNWVLANESFPCSENRMGPLCGQCKPGYAVTLYSTTCRDCKDKPAHYYLSLIFTLLFGLALVFVIIFFNIGASPIIDTLLFFTQAVYLMLEGRSEYENMKFLAFFNPNFTFDLCITPGLDNLTKVILQYVTPVYILLLMGVILLLTCFKRVSRLLGNHSILQGLWLLFLITYFNIAMATFEILYCGWVGPETIDGMSSPKKYVLVHDASIQCYTGLHLPFALIAWALVVLFVLPVPWYLLAVIRFSKLKPISDVYCSQYKDSYRWWIVLSLKRRLLLVLVGVFTQDYVTRHYFLLLSIALIVFVTMVMSPYRSPLDNYFSIFVTWMLLITSINTQPDTSTGLSIRVIVTYIIVVSILVVGLALVVFEVIVQRLRKQNIDTFYQVSMRPKLKRSHARIKEVTSSLSINKGREDKHELEASTASTFIPKHSTVDATGYREPLLDSQFYSSEEADRFATWNRNETAPSATVLRAPSDSSACQESAFTRKKFKKEGLGERRGGGLAAGTSVTEVSTWRESDSGLAATTSYINHSTTT